MGHRAVLSGGPIPVLKGRCRQVLAQMWAKISALMDRLGLAVQIVLTKSLRVSQSNVWLGLGQMMATKRKIFKLCKIEFSSWALRIKFVRSSTSATSTHPRQQTPLSSTNLWHPISSHLHWASMYLSLHMVFRVRIRPTRSRVEVATLESFKTLPIKCSIFSKIAAIPIKFQDLMSESDTWK